MNSYVLNLGKLVGNLHSLEFILRMVLQKIPDAKPKNLPYGLDIYDLPVGTEISESEFTSYDSLRELISKFNDFAAKNKSIPIDSSIISIRDAIAHGRISALKMDAPLHLIKFSRPVDGKVKITFNEVLTEEWFKVNIELVRNAIEIVSGYHPFKA
ncbi:MAG: hypothetical protein HZB42_03535 [Sphingobacteriales bacterium]|nr:hypothetical protein [Sphingobacteriales bacterium]